MTLVACALKLLHVLILLVLGDATVRHAAVGRQTWSEPHAQGAVVPVPMTDRRFDGDPAVWAARFDDPARDQWQRPDHVIATLALQPGQRIADVGAGTGYFAIRLAKAQPLAMVYAVDIEPAMVSYLGTRAAAEGTANVVPHQGSPDGPNLTHPVDLVLMVDTYHHLADRVTYFGHLRRWIRRGGRVAIIEHRGDAVDAGSAHMRLTSEQIVDEMREAGYHLAARHDTLPRQHFLEFRLAN